MLQFTKRQLFLGVSALIGALLLSHQTGLYTPFGSKLAERAAGFGLDNDPYSDVDIDPPIEVVVPTCPGIKFTPLPFNTAVSNVWYDLQTPLALSATYFGYGADPSGGRYGREHIYEVQLLALFIGSIRNDPNSQQIWNFNSNDFCGWVNYYLNQGYGGGASLINRLRQCLPNNANPYPNGPFMPWLEQTTNGIKANAWGGKAIRTEQTFKNYSADKKVSVMRATAGVKSYMSIPLATTSWSQQSACVRTEWANWLAIYQTEPSVPLSAKNVNIVNSYALWETNRIQQYQAGLMNGMGNMITWWNDVYNGSANAVNVRLNYPNRLNQSPQTAVTGQDLVHMWNVAALKAAQFDGPFAELLNSTLDVQ